MILWKKLRNKQVFSYTSKAATMQVLPKILHIREKHVLYILQGKFYYKERCMIINSALNLLKCKIFYEIQYFSILNFYICI